MQNHLSKFLFLVNPAAGAKNTDWQEEISKYFASKPHRVELFTIPPDCNIDKIKQKITGSQPTKVIAVGGDGTIKLIASAMLGMNLPLGILPAGSANGLAKELNIPLDPQRAIEIVETGKPLNIHLLKVNDELCIHLSDIGYNAYLVKKFEAEEKRGMWSYVKAAWKALLEHTRMTVDIETDSDVVRREAQMLVVANATRYGSGAVINPEGKLDDRVFEVVIVRRISFGELFKMVVTHRPYDKNKTEVFQTRSLTVKSKHKVDFQVDGEYLGKTNNVKATIISNALQVIVPAPG
jgi:diacylglycerol kinase (ATP)